MKAEFLMNLLILTELFLNHFLRKNVLFLRYSTSNLIAEPSPAHTKQAA